MLSVGIDLVEISRIRRSLENPRFLARVYGGEELAAHRIRKGRDESLAAAFAAKEAFSKALGTGVRGFSLPEVQVLHDALGAPYLSLSGRAAELAAEKNLEFSLSLTHTDQYASAVVVAYGKGAFA